MIIAGVDEVGRGCLAGPVTAAAVILMNPILQLKDSKQISPSRREILSKKIKRDSVYSFASVSKSLSFKAASILLCKDSILPKWVCIVIKFS